MSIITKLACDMGVPWSMFVAENEVAICDLANNTFGRRDRWGDLEFKGRFFRLTFEEQNGSDETWFIDERRNFVAKVRVDLSVFIDVPVQAYGAENASDVAEEVAGVRPDTIPLIIGEVSRRLLMHGGIAVNSNNRPNVITDVRCDSVKEKA